MSRHRRGRVSVTREAQGWGGTCCCEHVISKPCVALPQAVIQEVMLNMKELLWFLLAKQCLTKHHVCMR